MLTVTVDGQTFDGAALGAMRTTADLVELIKASIDPECMITSIRLNGQDLNDTQWRSVLSPVSTDVIEFTTGLRREFLADRLSAGPELLEQITQNFKTAAGSFNKAASFEGNESFATAVNDLLAYINWFTSCLELDPITRDVHIASFTTHIKGIHVCCEQLLQQQLHNAWWALGITIDKKLIPQLEALTDFTRGIAEGKVV